MKDGGGEAKGANRAGASVIELLRDTAEGLGQLVIQHVKLAQLDLTANARAMASRATIVAVCALLMVVGYTLAMAGLALVLGGGRAVGLSLVGVGVVHLLGAGLSMLVVLKRLRRPSAMKTSAVALGESARVLLAPKLPAHSSQVAAVSAPTRGAGATSSQPRLEQAGVL